MKRLFTVGLMLLAMTQGVLATESKEHHEEPTQGFTREIK